MTKFYLTLERTPLFFLDEQQDTYTDPLIEVEKDFYEAYERTLTEFRVIQDALFRIYLEKAAENRDILKFRTDDEEEDLLDEIFEPVQDDKYLH